MKVPFRRGGTVQWDRWNVKTYYQGVRPSRLRGELGLPWMKQSCVDSTKESVSAEYLTQSKKEFKRRGIEGAIAARYPCSFNWREKGQRDEILWRCNRRWFHGSARLGFGPMLFFLVEMVRCLVVVYSLFFGNFLKSVSIYIKYKQYNFFYFRKWVEWEEGLQIRH